jgi:hypothetical protein
VNKFGDYVEKYRTDVQTNPCAFLDSTHLDSRIKKLGKLLPDFPSYVCLLKKSLDKSPFGRRRMKYEDNIKTNLRKIICDNGRWIKLARDGSIIVQ